MNAQKRFLVAGLGSIGRRHLANLRQLRPDSHLAALRHSHSVDTVEGQPEAVFHSIENALAFMPDAVVIASPAPFHVETARAFLSAAVPLLIEKPLADRLAGTEVLVSASAQSGACAMVGYNLRFEPAVQRMHELVRAGAVGDIRLARGYVGQYLPDWRPGQDYRCSVSARQKLGGGPLLELSHEIDLVCWLFGAPDVVHCRGGRYSALEIDVEDAVELALEYERPRRLVTLGLNFLDRAPTRRLTIVGSDASVTWDGIARRVTLHPGAGDEAEIFNFAGGGRNLAYLAELDHFLACTEGRETPRLRIEDGLRVLAVVEAARESMRTGAGVSMSVGDAS